MEPTEIRAVEMVRAIRDQMYEETKDMSGEEYLAYIAREAAKLRAMLKQETAQPRDVAA